MIHINNSFFFLSYMCIHKHKVLKHWCNSVQLYFNSQMDHLPMLLSLDPLQMFPLWPRHQSLQASSSAQLSPVHNQGTKYITNLVCLCWRCQITPALNITWHFIVDAVTGYSHKYTSPFAAKNEICQTILQQLHT